MLQQSVSSWKVFTYIGYWGFQKLNRYKSRFSESYLTIKYPNAYDGGILLKIPSARCARYRVNSILLGACFV